MPKITFNQAKKFLEKINNKDKVAVIHHDDGDGFCSGIIFYDWCKNKKAKVKQFTYEIGVSSLKKYKLKKFNKIIICDIAPNLIIEDLELIKNKEVFYTDHHPEKGIIPKEILEYRTINEYIPSSRTAGELTDIKPWLSLVGTITDSGDLYPENTKFINKILKKYNFKLEHFKENTSSTITNFIGYFKKNPKKAFKILDKIEHPNEIEKLEKYSKEIEIEIEKHIRNYESKSEKIGNINFYYFKPKLATKKAVTQILSQKYPKETFIFAFKKNNGKNISLSARNNSKKKNMVNLLKAGTKNLENANTGGHFSAAGGMILTKDLEKFKENIRIYTKSKYSK